MRLTHAGKTRVVEAAEFAALPRVEVPAVEPHAQKEHRYGGVAVRELLALVGVPLGEKLRGRELNLVVIVGRDDGYAVVFALAEFDASFSTRTIGLADQVDGQKLMRSAGPLHLIALGDKRGARWPRMVTAIGVTSAIGPPAPVKS